MHFCRVEGTQTIWRAAENLTLQMFCLTRESNCEMFMNLFRLVGINAFN